MREPPSKIISLSEAARIAGECRALGGRVITTNGCFDLLHWGHVSYLTQARALGDMLICGLNSDSSVRGLKGKGRPLQEEKIRALQLAGLEAVDWIVIFSEKTPEAFLEEIRPTLHVKGGDYLPKALPERAVVEAHGGTVDCLPLVPGFSTSELIRKLKSLS